MICHVRHLGTVDYVECYQSMVDFSLSALDATPDELWCLEHPPVYTVGLNGNSEHLLNVGDIPVVQTDRGGQVTYHGPGQLVVYCLLNMHCKDYGVRELVQRLEKAIIDQLDDYGVPATQKAGAPGVYVQGRKIAALGIRVKRGRTWHGIALNVNMDLSPYNGINPCGYRGLEITQLDDIVPGKSVSEVATDLAPRLASCLELGQPIRAGEATPENRHLAQL